ncbi:hormogonium polysaccharide secretion pseudopilin HpsC [Nostoc sp. UHCC 0251]|uniref:hormogonium polysaccharide secretion pseudopilin HpsC n=1 Tax=Nostoc sp. UHCC 0251 TaxID=3110240 RepID=UPI002B20A591|nr:hormogonium polysaccharide secretion pseudopilin HpsC [Nostoc sp. UHCC 0251]MEA5621599.1 hormogonium polysaccharide secretion pseudopilin HpsC [Nostoc sp. UHCC 0251]
MISTLKFLLSNQLKRSKGIQQVDGFTLIELLVAMILAFLIITPLLGFMVNIMSTDRQEQAKANSEQEIQAALDYIARDLQQAIYIYDATGVGCLTGTADTTTCPNAGTTGNQLPNPTATDRVPILVFWKRELVSQVITVGTQQDDTFVYSLVAYYLIKDTNTTWSNAARIARWQIRDGVPDPSSTQTCGKYLTGQCPSPSFALFKLDGIGTITQKMNAWTKAAVVAPAVPPAPLVLVDFIDQTKTDDVPETPSVTCPPNSANNTWSKVPPNTATFNTRDTYKMTGFYSCVDRVNTTAQVFIRGNALARIETDSNKIKYADSKKTYFPTASIRVQGRGYLFTK